MKYLRKYKKSAFIIIFYCFALTILNILLRIVFFGKTDLLKQYNNNKKTHLVIKVTTYEKVFNIYKLYSQVQYSEFITHNHNSACNFHTTGHKLLSPCRRMTETLPQRRIYEHSLL